MRQPSRFPGRRTGTTALVAAALLPWSGAVSAAGWGPEATTSVTAAPREAPLPLFLAQALSLRPAPQGRSVAALPPADREPLALMRSDQLSPGGSTARLGAAAATSGNPARVTLAQAYELALRNDSTLRAARAAATGRFERVPQARSQLLPQVNSSVTRFKNSLESSTPGPNGQNIVASDRYFSGSRNLTIRQPLFNALHRADLRQAHAQVDEAEATLEKEVQNLAVRVSTAYLQVLAGKDQLALVLAQSKAYRTQLEAARRRFQEGAGTRTDIDEAQARLDLSFAKELEARQSIDLAARQLQVLIDVPLGELGTLAADRLVPQVPQPEGVEAWTAQAEEHSPELRAARAQVEAARQEYEKARSAHLPTVDAVAQWSISESDNITRLNTRYDQKAVGVQVNIPLYSGGLTSSQVRQAAAEIERTREAFEALRRDLGVRVHREHRAIGEAVLRVRALEQAVRSSSQLVESARKSFQAGSRTLVDILNAEEQRSTAERDLAEARYLYVLSQIRLRALTGEADSALIERTSGWLAY